MQFSTAPSKLFAAASSFSKIWSVATHRCRSTHWIEYRIGVNLGDVIIEPDDVYGDGVNIATRLEGIADPGQVYISGGIYEQIKHKLVCGYESLGDRKVKNITDPVRVYRVLPDAAAFSKTRKRRENVLIFLLSLTLLIIAGGVLWYLLLQPRSQGRRSGIGSRCTSRRLVEGARAAGPRGQTGRAAISAGSGREPGRAARAGIVGPRARNGRASGRQLRDGQQDDVTEKPIHQVTIKPFAISKYPVTVRRME